MSYDCPDAIEDICSMLEKYNVVPLSAWTEDLTEVSEKVEQVLIQRRAMIEALRTAYEVLIAVPQAWNTDKGATGTSVYDARCAVYEALRAAGASP